MSEIARIANQIKKLDSLIFRTSRTLQEHPDHAILPLNIQGMEATKRQLKRRFQALSNRHWVDVCRYDLNAKEDGFIPLKGVVTTLNGFQCALGVTLDAVISGKPKTSAHLSIEGAEQSTMRLGYTEGGDRSGDFAFTMVVEKRKELFEPINDSINKLLSIAECEDTPHIHRFAEELGPAPIRAVADWSNYHVKSNMDSRLDWVRESKIERTLNMSVDKWSQLKETIDMVSDKITEEVEVLGTLIAANIKTRAFVIQAEHETIAGKFEDGVINRNNAASIPRDYKFHLKRTEHKNYATERTTVKYTMVALTPFNS